MPELPEVEWGRKLASRVAEGRRIVESWVDLSDDIVFDGSTPSEVAGALEGAKVLAVRRRGKQLWFELDRRPWPLFHFGMTGAFHVPGQRPLALSSDSGVVDGAWPPRFTKIRLAFDDGGALAMVNKRRLGRIRLRQDPAAEAPISELGFDPLDALPSLADFRTLLSGRKKTLKGLLLDQRFAAGIGNWIADEVLFQAGLDPRRRADRLEAEEQQLLHQKLDAVIQHAVAVDADKSKFPDAWLFHHRWGKSENARTAGGDAIEFIQVAGRTTAWVPSIQR